MRNLLVACCWVVIALLPRPVQAQSITGLLPFVPQVQTPPIEGAIGLSINSLSVDVNAESECRAFTRPCTNDRASTFGGFGLDGEIAWNRSDRHALVFAAHLQEHGWESGQPASRNEWNATRTVLVGSRIQSDWISGRFSREPSRVFVQALGGVGHSTATGRHPVVQVGGGIDGIAVVPSRYANRLVDLVLRMSVDYRFPLARDTDLRGVQFGFALVIGPHR